MEEDTGELVFSEEEVRQISGLNRGTDYVEVTCGCTSRRYGDAVGKLMVFVNGDLEISCECSPGCQEGVFSLSSHSHSIFPSLRRACYGQRLLGMRLPLIMLFHV